MTTRFRGVIAVEEQPVPGHGVTFKRGALSWPESVPLRLGFTDRIIGKVEKIERDGDDIHGQVVLSDSAPPFELDDDGSIIGCSLAVEVMFDKESPVDAPTGTITTVSVVPEPTVRSESEPRDLLWDDVFRARLLRQALSTAEVAQAVETAETVAARAKAAEAVLREVEWKGSAWIGLACCPLCGGEKGEGHDEGCALATVLATAQ